MPTKLTMTRDQNGYNTFGLPPSDTNYSAALDTSTDTTLTVPGSGGIGDTKFQTKNKWLAVFSFDPGTSVWVNINATATVPAGATFAATLSMLNPAAIEVNGGDVIHCISAGTAVEVSIRLYAIT